MATKVIVRNPSILGGEPIFRGTRVPFKSLTDYIEHGRTLNEFLEDFPSVTRTEAIAALEEAQGTNGSPFKHEGPRRVPPKHLSLHQNRDSSGTRIESRGYQ